MSLLKVRSIASNFDCKGISSVIDSTIENHRTPIKSEQCEINVYPQDIAFDCAHIASDCNDRAIQTAESKKSRPSTLLRQEPGLMFYSETVLIKVKSFNFDSFNVIQGRSTGLKSQNFQDSLTIC